MIVRTLERALLADCFERIVCATDSEKIAEVVSRAGFEFILTGPAATGSDRVAEAARTLDLDLVVNLQGDEPLVEPSLLAQVAQALSETPEYWITVACPLDPKESTLKTVVKVRVEDGFAVDFTRQVPPEEIACGGAASSCDNPILSNPSSGTWFQHQGIYAYSRAARDEFAALPQNEVELSRSLEQMRILGKRPIRIVQSPYPSISVDVPADAEAVEARIRRERR